MPENKPKRFLSARGWIEENAASGTTTPTVTQPAAPQPAGLKEPRIGIGVGLAVAGWVLTAAPIMGLNAYIALVNDCLSSGQSGCAGSTEGANIPIVIFIIACMLVGPAFLGIAAATGRGWAWLVTGLLALPVVGGVLYLVNIMVG